MGWDGSDGEQWEVILRMLAVMHANLGTRLPIVFALDELFESVTGGCSDGDEEKS